MYCNKIKNLTRAILRRLHILRNGVQDYYISKIEDSAPWVYIAYITAVFDHRNDDVFLSTHQNKREALCQVELFNELGYNVYVQHYLSKGEITNKKFDIIFGHEPNFVRAAEKNPDAFKIHYVPGAYIDHRNKHIIKMTDYVNKTYNGSIPYRRLLLYDNPNHGAKAAYKLADKILLIGSKYTVETFPVSLRSKIVTIHQSTQLTRTVKKIEYANNNEYFFMGSSGNLLKGISLLVEYFSRHKEHKINIVGPIEPDVREALHSLFYDNIIIHGFVDVNSDKMIEIMSRCNFIIYPSGSEGGAPGALLNSMKNGLIPITTKWAAFDEIDDYGFILDGWSVEAIEKGVNWSLSLTPDDVYRMKNDISSYVNHTYTISRYKEEFKRFILNNIS